MTNLVTHLRAVDPNDVTAVIQALGAAADELERRDQRDSNLAKEVEQTQRLNADIERLKDALKRVRRVAAERTTHTGLVAALGILVDRSLNPGSGPLPPEYTYAVEPKPNAGVKCTHCNGKGKTPQVYDERRGGWSDPDVPCETCDGSGRIRTVEQYLKTLPANWHEDSSLQTWFPLTAEQQERHSQEFERYRDALYAANGYLIQLGKDPVKLDYTQRNNDARK